MDSLYLEIFGCEDQATPADRKTPELPMDSPLYDYSPTTGAGDAFVRKTQDDYFLDEVLGSRDEAGQVFRSSPKPSKSVPMVLPDLDFAKIWNQASDRASRIHKAAPERAAQINMIVRKARRAAPRSIQGDPRWADLATALAQFVSQSLIEA
jgi:hypothetical protein